MSKNATKKYIYIAQTIFDYIQSWNTTIYSVVIHSVGIFYLHLLRNHVLHFKLNLDEVCIEVVL